MKGKVRVGKKATYKVKATDRGKKQRVTVTGKKTGYKSVKKTRATKKVR